MDCTIPVKADQTDKNELLELLSQIEEEIPDIKVQSAESSGLAMDPATIALLIELAKVTVPALITTIGTIWVAYIQKKKTDKPKTSDSHPAIVLETDTANIRINLNTSNVKESILNASLPKTVDKIVRIRLE